MKSRTLRTAVFLMASVMGLSAAAGDSVPFRATFQTAPVPIGPCGEGCFALEIRGTGQATHMGMTEIAGPSEVSVPCDQQTGTSTLTSANGDTIQITFSGTVICEGPTLADPVTFQGAWDAIGGTGRFTGVTGSGTYSGGATGGSGELLLIGDLGTPHTN